MLQRPAQYHFGTRLLVLLGQFQYDRVRQDWILLQFRSIDMLHAFQSLPESHNKWQHGGFPRKDNYPVLTFVFFRSRFMSVCPVVSSQSRPL
jgi:hypothetical protein